MRMIDFELIVGVWLIVDFLFVFDFGNIFFVWEWLDEFMEGGIFNFVEGVID